MKPVASQLRDKGFVSVIYLDDFFLVSSTYSDCIRNVSETCSLLKRLGFIINERKSQLIPSHTCKFLGLNFNSSLILAAPN